MDPDDVFYTDEVSFTHLQKITSDYTGRIDRGQGREVAAAFRAAKKGR